MCLEIMNGSWVSHFLNSLVYEEDLRKIHAPSTSSSFSSLSHSGTSVPNFPFVANFTGTTKIEDEFEYPATDTRHARHPNLEDFRMQQCYAQHMNVEEKIVDVHPICPLVADETDGRHFVIPEGPVDADRAEKSVDDKNAERRQKRMIKNRESAARSRAKKQAYIKQLEDEVKELQETNKRLKTEKVLMTYSRSYPGAKCKLQRSYSWPSIWQIKDILTVDKQITDNT